LALSKRKKKKLGIVDVTPHGLVAGDRFYVYGTEVGTVVSVEGDAPNGVTFTWNDRTVVGLPPGKVDTTWEKLPKAKK
jgi:hypothetical protein